MDVLLSYILPVHSRNRSGTFLDLVAPLVDLTRHGEISAGTIHLDITLAV